MNIKILRSQSTLRLLVLTIFTFCVYPVHYLKRLTALINAELQTDERISSAFVHINFFFTYLSLLMLAPYVMCPEGHPIESVSDSIDNISLVLILVWAFKVRNRLNSLLAHGPHADIWFSGLWTFIFQDLYINYRINVLSDKEPDTETSSGDPDVLVQDALSSSND